jgi:hypothetical protein
MIKGVATYCQVHKIINEEISDRKKFFYEEGITCHYFSFWINMDLLICILSNTILMVWCISHVIYMYIKKKSLFHFVLWQPMIYECFPKDLCEFLNFKFISKILLIHVNIVSLQIQIFLC